MANAPTREELIAYARAEAVKNGINPDIFVAQIQQESGFRPYVKPNAWKAAGIAQFIPSTAKTYGVDVNDPFSSLRGAAKMMGDKFRKYGTPELALAAYNGGDGAADEYKNKQHLLYKPDNSAPLTSWKNETRNYVTKIMARAGAAPESPYQGSPDKFDVSNQGKQMIAQNQQLTQDQKLAENTPNLFGHMPTQGVDQISDGKQQLFASNDTDRGLFGALNMLSTDKIAEYTPTLQSLSSALDMVSSKKAAESNMNAASPLDAHLRQLIREA